MHILLIHQAFAAINEPGGTRHHEISRFLVERGHQVTVIASPVSYLSGTSSHKTDEFIEGVRILRAYTYVALHRSFIHRFFAFVSFMISSFFLGIGIKQVDLVWGTSPPIFQGVTALFLARIKGAKFLFEVRDLWPEFAVAIGVLKNPILIKLSEWLERFLYRNSDQAIVNSPGYLEHVRERGGKNVTLVPNGADLSMFNGNIDSASFIRQNHLDGKFIVLYAGAHGISNDLGVLIGAAELLLDVPKIQIVLVGDGKEKENLIKQAQEKELTNLTFIKSTPKDQMAAVIASSDVCVGILKPIDSYKKTYPNKIFDYMAGAKPIALVIDGVIRDVVTKADCGIFCQPGDPNGLANCIRRYYQDPDLRRRHGENGRRYLKENFDREMIAENFLVLINLLITPE
ncbi:MAG TPA: glycosyltransferase family 4 protein [Anaerolineales bacterium]|nr:glycosyltransferase family 4 protein [Anaerolineales bacterium]